MGCSGYYFIDRIGGVDSLDLEEIPAYSLNFGYVLGILAFSYS